MSILPFSQINKQTVPQTGGKGASLGEMTQAGIPVPPGFVVLTDAFEAFLAQADLTQEIVSQLDKVNHQEMASVELASEHIRDLILNAAIPAELGNEIEVAFDKLGAEFVAVRSSATAEDGAASSWAGELDTFLNTTKETLLENVRRCWASLFTPRAIFYRFEKGFNKSHVSVAVVVQKMVQSEVSGIAFSVHPVTEDPNQLIIEAGWGLGEAIVSGSITPDSYVVDKRDWSLVDVNVVEQERKLVRSLVIPTEAFSGVVEGSNEARETNLQAAERNTWTDVSPQERNKQKLSNDQIKELAELVVKIEEHYGFPCDIEWAMEGGTIYIVQSRPITTLSIK